MVAPMVVPMVTPMVTPMVAPMVETRGPMILSRYSHGTPTVL